MFPLKDNIPAQQFPVINTGLIVVNTVVFLFEFAQGPEFDSLIMQHGFIPARFIWQQSENLFDLSRFSPVFSSIFMHGGFIHLISNMWMLWIFGDNVEDCMGHGRYLLFYLLCGTVSVFAQGVSAPDSQIPLVGASGAISGVLGGYFLTYPRARVLTMIPIFVFFYMVELPAFFFLGFWFLFQFLQGYAQQLAVGADLQGGVAWWAHVGGFGAGVLLIGFFRQRHGRSSGLQMKLKP